MKTKSLQKLGSFKLQNEKLSTVLGGQGGPAQPSFDLGFQATGAGEMCYNGQCLSYSSDAFYPDGSYKYVNVNNVPDKSC